MRILTIINYYPPYHLGGQELSCQEIMEELRDRGHEVRVLTSRSRTSSPSEPLREDVLRDLFPEMDLSEPKNATYAFGPHYIRKYANRRIIRKNIQEFQPDVAFIWGMWNLHREVASETEALMNDRVLYRFADYWPTLPSQAAQYWLAPSGNRRVGALRRRLSFVPLSLLSAFDSSSSLSFAFCYCVSNAVKTRLLELGIPVNHANIIYSGLSQKVIDHSVSLASRGPSSSDRIGILYVGRLTPEKGVHILLSALKIISRRGLLTTWRLTIVGSGPSDYVDFLERLASEFPDGCKVDFTGHVPNSRLPAVFADHLITVMPSIWPEPFARVALEAMVSGSLVVASRLGGFPELVDDGKDGVLFEAGDAEELASKLEQLLADSELATRMAKSGQHKASGYTLEKTVLGIEEALRNAQNSRGNCGPTK